VPPEVPSLGLHKHINGASSVLQLRDDPFKGRHIVINEGEPPSENSGKSSKNFVSFCVFIFTDVKVGTVLFSEMPYSSVLLPEHSASHCHHCYKQFRVAVPCLKVKHIYYKNTSVPIYLISIFTPSNISLIQKCLCNSLFYDFSAHSHAIAANNVESTLGKFTISLNVATWIYCIPLELLI
jgi:hypothetical protein